MATVVLAPGPFGAGYQALTSGGLPLNGGFINTYNAGGSTPTATYTTSLGNIQNANPIQLDAAGRPPAEIWLLQGQSYKFVVTDSQGANAQTFDNLPGINDASALIGTIAIAQGGTGQTTTNAALDALHAPQAFVTAAATLNLDSVSSSYAQVLGNTAITAVTLTNGRERTLEFLSTVAISSNSTLILPGGTTITALAGDTTILRGEANGVVRSVMFQRASGGAAAITTLSNALAANVSCINTASYFIGPQVSAAGGGVWSVVASILVSGPGADTFNARLSDGTTIAASTAVNFITGTAPVPITLAGKFTNPAANIRLEARDTSSVNGFIAFNASGNSKDGTIIATKESS